MIELKEFSDGFGLIFRGKNILNHSKNQPCVELGSGNEEFRPQVKNQGYFKPKDQIMASKKLQEFTILNDGASKIKIQLDSYIILDIQEKNGKIELEPRLIKDTIESKPINRFSMFIPSEHGERIYGCGEQFSKLQLNGNNVPLWTQEPGLGRDHSIYAKLANLYAGAGGAWHTTYYPQCSFISSKNYYVHVDNYWYSNFDFRNDNYHRLHFWGIPDKITMGVENDAIDTLSSVSSLLGRQPALPEWAVNGVWLGIGGGLDESSQWSVSSKLKTALEAGVRVSAIWSQDWTGLYSPTKLETKLFWNWEYDPERYPDLPSYIKKLNQKEIKFLGYNNCFLMPHGWMYEEAAKQGYLVKTKGGQVYDISIFSTKAGMLDLTNPEARDWIKSIIKKHMIKIGLSGWMCDYAEYLPVDCVLHSGEDPKVHHNEYPVLWAKVNHEAVEEAKRELGARKIVFFNRSGNAGTSRYCPLIWAGDQMAKFHKHNGLASVICAGISLGFSGIGHFHSDIGGLFSMFWMKRSKEVFQRWTELAAFTPVMRTHEGHDYESYDNWKFDGDEDTLAHFARFSKIHSALLPYTKHLLNEYQEKGIPLIRHPYIHYEKDIKLHEYQYQYMYGRDLFVAPVHKKKKTRWKCYLPQDEWIHLWSGESLSGGKIKIDAPIGEPPIFYRKASNFKDVFEKLREL